MALVLGDNVFFGHGLSEMLEDAARQKSGASVFAYAVQDPERYGVVAFDEFGKATSIEEKPFPSEIALGRDGFVFLRQFRSGYRRGSQAFRARRTGNYGCEQGLCYSGALSVRRMGRGFAWLDTGTHESLLEAGNFIQTLEKRQGLQIACLEEIAFAKGWITAQQVEALAKPLAKNTYGQYLLRLVEGKA